MKVSDLVNDIHIMNLNRKYFWSCGLIRETIELWKNKENFAMLDDDGKTIALHYLEEGKGGMRNAVF